MSILDSAEKNMELLEKSLVLYEQIAQKAAGLKDPVSRKAAAGDYERSMEVIKRCQEQIEEAEKNADDDKEKHQKAKRMVDRAGEIVKRIHELMEMIAKKSNNVKENSVDEKVGADQGERGENLALTVGTAHRWFTEGCKRNAASSLSKRSGEEDEEDEEPRVKSVKKREVEDVPGRYESSGWAKNVQMCADLFKK
ncbi:hypothetical protein GCK72_007291 [Caenorhabditis remanei]|uniref:Uncharacterized protein n=1 Tax=Caenorhabditis remanei TaxID=31234 RepID=A0A6A5HNH7_CAERE|nr:hypothetical protein GCK72_007291 [Caenorhabditis remanei]KAF1767332.1 hypothetical protein GCK72_007291 [Caenorhabditis remanei]